MQNANNSATYATFVQSCTGLHKLQVLKFSPKKAPKYATYATLAKVAPKLKVAKST